MKTTATFEWTESNVIPPGCRKPRDVARTDSMEVELAVVTGTEAPVALRYPGTFASEGEPLKELRWWGGRLWRHWLPISRDTTPQHLGSPMFPLEPKFTSYSRLHLYADSIEIVQERVREHLAGFLVVDGEVFEPATEPAYRVYAPTGRGRRFDEPRNASISSYDNGARSDERTYSALDFAVALADAQDAVKRFGDAGVVETTEPSIEVLIPEAVRIVTTPYFDALEPTQRERLMIEVVDAQAGLQDEHTEPHARRVLDALIEAEGWALSRRYLDYGFEEDDVAKAARHQALVRTGVLSEAPKVARTVFTFELLHDADATFEDLQHALREAWDGGAVGSERVISTVALGDALVPAALHALGNDGTFFDDVIERFDSEPAEAVATA